MNYTPMTRSEIDALRVDLAAGASGHASIHNDTHRAIRTLHNRLSDGVSSVTDPDVGADSTGETDSTAALQAAFDAGGEWYVPPGMYNIGTLTIPGNTTIRAARGAVFSQAGNGTDPGILLGNGNIALHNIALQCASGTSPAGILSEGASDVILNNVRINGNFRYSEAVLLISGGNWHWDLIGGKYEQSNGHSLDLRGGGAAMNFWGAHFSFSAGYSVYQRGKGEAFALQMTGCVAEGSITGQMFADTLLGAAITNTHFENSTNATCIPLRLGSYPDVGEDDPYGGACIGVNITGCNFNAERAPYCVNLDTVGVNRAITIQNCRLAGQDGYLTAGIAAKRVTNSYIVANWIPQSVAPHVQTVGDGYYPSNLFIQDETTCGSQFLT